MRVFKTKMDFHVEDTFIRSGLICVIQEGSYYVCFSPSDVKIHSNPLGLPIYKASLDFFSNFVDEVTEDPECYMRAIEINEEYLDIEGYG